MSGIGFGYGKVILLGEHFVVHGLPALVTSLPLKTIAQVKITESISFFNDQRPKVPGFQPTKTDKYQRMLERVLEYLNIKDPLEVTLSGDLPVTSGGIGASAATAVALVRALNQAYNLELSDEQIHEAAFYGEIAIHGKPSGIDTTAATYGGLFLFKKERERFFKQPVNGGPALHLVLVDSGVVSDTQMVIAQVNELFLKKPQVKNEIFGRYHKLIHQAQQALKNNDLKKLGLCMNENHKLLQAIGLSTSRIDDLIKKARELGALGAKLTGTGKGGLVVALISSEKKQRYFSRFFDNFFLIP